MTLFKQFQVFIGTIVLGMLFMFLWSLFNRMFFKYQGKWVRVPFEAVFLVAIAFGYFQFLLFVCGGILNLHYLLALLIGLAIYLRFYANYVNIWLEEIIIKTNKLVIKINKILVPLKKRYAILKSKVKKFKVDRKNAKQKRKQSKKNIS